MRRSVPPSLFVLALAALAVASRSAGAQVPAERDITWRYVYVAQFEDYDASCLEATQPLECAMGDGSAPYPLVVGVYHDLFVSAVNGARLPNPVRVQGFDAQAKLLSSTGTQLLPGTAQRLLRWSNDPVHSAVRGDLRTIVVSSERPLHLSAYAAFFRTEGGNGPGNHAFSKRAVTFERFECPSAEHDWFCAVAGAFPPQRD